MVDSIQKERGPKISLSNSQARHVCDNLYDIADTCFENLDLVDAKNWKEALFLYRKFTQTLRSGLNFTDDMINDFRLDVDNFMDL